jgi:hypothetical protein
MSVRLALLVGAALVCGGCKVSSDIGKTCVLVRKATAEEQKAEPDKEPFRYIMESQLTAGQDFISFGSVECEDLVCVRDADYDPQLEATADRTKVAATGYCSKPCVADTDNNALTTDACAVTSDEALPSVKASMTCRAMLLDQQALDALRAADRTTYRTYFGDNTSPFFCAVSKPTSTTP